MNEVGGVLLRCTMFETFFAYHKDFLACTISVFNIHNVAGLKININIELSSAIL